MGRPTNMAIAGVFAAIAITTAMDATGLSDFSALSLLPLMLLFWRLDRLSAAEIGFRLGAPRDYGWAILYPLAVIGGVAAIAWSAGAVDLSETDWNKALLNLAAITLATILVACVTEEGFFRGWLWASLTRSGLSPTGKLFWTSFAFMLWHVSAITLPTGFDVPPPQIPVFLANALLLGAIWGLLRERSDSIVVASVSHGVWNGLAYSLFGFGTHVGALGIADTAVFGPEVGLTGLALNLLFFLALWRWGRTQPAQAVTP